MNLELSLEQHLLQDAVAKFLQRESTPARVRSAEPTGHDPALWAGMAALGLPLLRVPEDRGGAAMSLFDAVLVAEQCGRHLASAALVENQVAAGLLSTCEHPIAATWLARLGAGEALLCLALEPLNGDTCQLVPGGAVADALLCLEGDHLCLVETDNQLRPVHGHDLPLAEWCGGGARTVLGSGQALVAAHQAAVVEWRLLTAAVQAGAARTALEQAAAYACERQAFARPIGSFQGLAHPLADAVTDIDGGWLALWQAVDALARGLPEAATQVPLACWWLARAAPRATVRAMRTFGGYGMTLEYDAQIYFRRSRALALVAGDPARELATAGAALFATAPPPALPQAGDIGIDFAYGPAAENAAAEARAFMEANLDPELRAFALNTDDGHHPAFIRKLAAAGLLYPDWPPELGGGRDPWETQAIHQVLAEFDWAPALIQVADMVAKVVMAFGSAEVKAEVLPGIARGELFCALGYSEPSCGSDVFSARTRALRDGADWLIDGQKMFTSQGHVADFVLLLARTNPDAAKHAGLTLFLVPTRQPGYTVQEVKTLSAERTNITYYDRIRVPDRYRLGAIDGGVKIMAAALAMEQGGNGYFANSLRQVLRHALTWARSPGPGGRVPAADPGVRTRLAAVAAQVQVAEALTHRSIWAAANGCGRKFFGPMAKLFASEAWLACTAEVMELAAPAALTGSDEALARIELENRRGIPSTVWGGASEIQRSLIAEEALGLPRTRN